MHTKLITVNFHLDPDGDDDTKRNNKCWLIWEVSICMHVVSI